ncbi:PIN domain-containing protein [Streptomyces paromomycinus]|uniref:Ribonuclease VapC26 n=1 Tax=Streptomyces paromomycinus TaxID=92743 RepID=A0A401WF04_STREY|nr:PIN domain-containing protein [Streptomyces paromomycinus]GCD47871.1 ribonuclease VapC26 [Streptomyces paromomycinus]
MTASPAFAVAGTSVLLAVFNARDRNHHAAREVLGLPRTLIISPLCLAELDYLLTRQAGERAALGAVRHLTALARLGRAQIADVDGELRLRLRLSPETASYRSAMTRRLLADTQALLANKQIHTGTLPQMAAGLGVTPAAIHAFLMP